MIALHHATTPAPGGPLLAKSVCSDCDVVSYIRYRSRTQGVAPPGSCIPTRREYEVKRLRRGFVQAETHSLLLFTAVGERESTDCVLSRSVHSVYVYAPGEAKSQVAFVSLGPCEPR